MTIYVYLTSVVRHNHRWLLQMGNHVCSKLTNDGTQAKYQDEKQDKRLRGRENKNAKNDEDITDSAWNYSYMNGAREKARKHTYSLGKIA